MSGFKLLVRNIKLINSGKNIRVVSIIGLFLVILGLPIVLVEVSNQQIFTPQASSQTCGRGFPVCPAGDFCKTSVSTPDIGSCIQQYSQGQICDGPNLGECAASLNCLTNTGAGGGYHCVTTSGINGSCTPGWQECSAGTCILNTNSNSGTCQQTNKKNIGDSCTPGQHECGNDPYHSGATLTCQASTNTCVSYGSIGDVCNASLWRYCAGPYVCVKTVNNIKIISDTGLCDNQPSSPPAPIQACTGGTITSSGVVEVCSDYDATQINCSNDVKLSNGAHCTCPAKDTSKTYGNNSCYPPATNPTATPTLTPTPTTTKVQWLPATSCSGSTFIGCARIGQPRCTDGGSADVVLVGSGAPWTPQDGAACTQVCGSANPDSVCSANATPTLTPTPTTSSCGTTQGQQCTNIWTDKTTYAIGDTMQLCYSVSQKTNISVDINHSDGTTENIADETGADDGTGACKSEKVKGPAGQTTAKLQTSGAINESASANYTVTGTADTCTTQGNTYSCMNPSCTSGYSQASSGTCSNAGSICCVQDQPQPTNTIVPTATTAPTSTTAPTDTPIATVTQGGATLTPTNTPTGTLTPTITPGGPTITPGGATLTPVPGTNIANLAIALQYTGIGPKTGPGFKTTNHPVTPQRLLTVDFYKPTSNTAGNPDYTAADTVNFDQTGLFTNTNADIGKIPDGTYKVYVKTNRYLRKYLGQQTVKANTPLTITNPLSPLIAGDINGDNHIDVLDYNALIACFPNTPLQNSVCDKVNADLNDDGNPTDNDWNTDLTILITNFGIQNGD